MLLSFLKMIYHFSLEEEIIEVRVEWAYLALMDIVEAVIIVKDLELF